MVNDVTMDIKWAHHIILTTLIINVTLGKTISHEHPIHDSLGIL
jgi:hypothetical protein